MTAPKEVILDKVDIDLLKEDGRIQRPKDPKFCRHGSMSKCAHCLPVDPFDEEYLQQKDIKHMSFHAHIRKLTQGMSKGRGNRITYPLENLRCSVRLDCKGHPPYPISVCFKCQPDPVSLSRQKYRHVDNISIENHFIVDEFLNYWRKTGHQRIGFLIGRYEMHSDVPLGIKAVVCAIYEPPQESTRSSVSLLEDPNEAAVDELCALLGLARVGWIFTDLTPDPSDPAKMLHTRNTDSYLMTAQECITAATFQNKYPNPCKLSDEGYFGSKFVTIVASADETQQIHFSGYQVSNQCAALVKDDWMVPTLGSPELAYVRDDQKFVPDVKYMEKDKYGNLVGKDGRPLPVEYLLVDVPCGAPKEPSFTFLSGSGTKKPFSIENRILIGDLQNFETFSTYVSQFSTEERLEMVSDFHLLLYLRHNDTCPISKESLQALTEGLETKDREKVATWCSQDPQWLNIQQLLAAQGPVASRMASADDDVVPMDSVTGASGLAKWACSHCTFENPGTKRDCEMCGLPRS